MLIQESSAHNVTKVTLRIAILLKIYFFLEHIISYHIIFFRTSSVSHLERINTTACKSQNSQYQCNWKQLTQLTQYLSYDGAYQHPQTPLFMFGIVFKYICIFIARTVSVALHRTLTFINHLVEHLLARFLNPDFVVYLLIFLPLHQNSH